MEATVPRDKVVFVLKLALYLLIAYVGRNVFAGALYFTTGIFIAVAGSVFFAALIANALLIRIFERGTLADIGLHWDVNSLRHFGVGAAAGIAASLLILLPALLVRAAVLEPDPGRPASWAGVLFVTVGLVFGAAGEEMLFRGYAFQLLLGAAGRFATILPTSVLFGLAHAQNENATWLGIVNTAGFGIVLGYAFTRSGDLWLPIGIHLGWNWTLPLFGVNLSGSTMGVTGVAMRWNVSALWSGGAYGIEASVLTTCVIVLLMWFLARWPFRAREPFLVARAGAE